MFVPVLSLRTVAGPGVKRRVGILDTCALRGPLPLGGNGYAVRVLALGGYADGLTLLQEHHLSAVVLRPHSKVHPDTPAALFYQQFVEVLFRFIADVE